MIDLIEYFGGYEQAKEVALEAKKGIDPVIYVNGEEVLIDFLTDQMLAYRRANNIFEVGDPIICTCKDADIKEVLFAKENFNSEKSGLVKCGDKGHMSFTCMLDVKDIRHANDAEIEANRRLDLPQIGSIIKVDFKNAAGEYIQVVGKVREFKGRTICCNEVGTGKPFFCLPGEFEKYDLPESVVKSLGEVS